MILSFASSSIEVPEAKVAALKRMAEHSADLVCDFLAENALATHVAPLPTTYAWELGAALLMMEWGNGGMLDHCEDQTLLIETLIKFICNGDDTARNWNIDCDPNSLSRTIFRVWLNRFAWSARQDLEVDLLLKGGDQIDEQQLNELAALLWALRRVPAQEGKGAI